MIKQLSNASRSRKRLKAIRRFANESVFDKVIKGSTTVRKDFALGKVVLMISC